MTQEELVLEGDKVVGVKESVSENGVDTPLVEVLERELSMFLNKIKTLEARVDDIENRTDEVEALVSDMETKVDEIENDLDDLKDVLRNV
jgi:chromosome segregation ATPase